MKMDTIFTEGLSKKYGDLSAVQSLDLHVGAGEIYGFLGPNGSGKTSTIMMLLGIEKPTCGKIFLFGEEFLPSRQISLRRRIGMMAENQYVYEDMTAFEYLSLFADINQVKKKAQRINTLLEAVNLQDFRSACVGTFSRGMQQKLALIRAMLHDPDLLILDEPVSGLDPYSIVEVRELIKAARASGKTIFLSSHILSEVEQTADRIGIIQKGKLIAEGTLESIRTSVAPQTELSIKLLNVSNQVITALQTSSQIKSVEVKENLLEITAEDSDIIRGQISETITGNGGVIVSMQVKQMSLEETFMTITDSNIETLLQKESLHA